MNPYFTDIAIWFGPIVMQHARTKLKSKIFIFYFKTCRLIYENRLQIELEDVELRHF